MKPSELLNFVLQKEIFLKHWSIVHITKDFLILAVCLTSYHPLEETLHRFVIFNYILDYIYSRFNHLLSSWNQDILQPNKLELYCYVIHEKGANVEFVGPKINKNIVYNGQKRVHDIKFQSAALPNGLTSNFSDSYVGKRAWAALKFTEISIGTTISPSAAMVIQHTLFPFILKPLFLTKSYT